MGLGGWREGWYADLPGDSAQGQQSDKSDSADLRGSKRICQETQPGVSSLTNQTLLTRGVVPGDSALGQQSDKSDSADLRGGTRICQQTGSDWVSSLPNHPRQKGRREETI